MRSEMETFSGEYGGSGVHWSGVLLLIWEHCWEKTKGNKGKRKVWHVLGSAVLLYLPSRLTH
jgi:hypothetical protein